MWSFLTSMRKGIINFKGEPHRLEFVREFKGVKYYNDSAATIPEALIGALEAFSEPIILLAGGSDKKLDFSQVGKILLSDKIRAIILLKGGATDKLIRELKLNFAAGEKAKEFEVFDNMEQAVQAANTKATAGDVVLLSPGAASFGLFLNEFDRGDKFRDAVNKLK